MKYLVTAQEMKQYDKNTIEYLGIPGPVLMERAALAAEDFIKERFDAVKERTKVLIFAGMGNNGGDGLALARLLAADGYAVAVKCVGDMQRATNQWKSQWQTLQHFPVKTDSNIAVDEYNVIVDALFGVGLSRPVEGNYADAVKEMNMAEGFKLALDVPSGICSDTGRVLGCAFLADATVTFGFCKRGLVLYPGAEYAGEVRTANVGIGQESFLGQEPEMYTYEKGSVQLLKRNAQGAEGRVVLLTPHVGEMSRLLKRTTSECKDDLPTCAKILAERFHAVAVAKDARTVVCKEQGACYLNTTGNSGMATAGSGDVLTGVILGLLAQGMDAPEAATCGVYLHGMAGDLAAGLHTEYGVMAGDIAECLMKNQNKKA